MSEIPIHRQQTFAFAKSGLWRQFPQQQQASCRDLVTQMLEKVFHASEQERSHHDREDS